MKEVDCKCPACGQIGEGANPLVVHHCVYKCINTECQVLEYAVSKQSPLPDIVVKDWRLGEKDGYYEIHGVLTDDLVPVAKGIHTLAIANLIAAAPKLMETGIEVAKLYLRQKAAVDEKWPGAGLSKHVWGDNLEYEAFLDALRDAGVGL